MEKDVYQLLEKYRRGQCTEEEKQLVERFLDGRVQNSDALPDEQKMLRSVVRLNDEFKRNQRWNRFYERFRVAVLLVFLSVGLYVAGTRLLGPDKSEDPASRLASTEGEIAPGGNRAFLTLADGRRVELSSSQQGIQVDGTAISYLDGSSVDIPGNADGAAIIELAKITTPRGGTYQVQLGDGSKVTLNAASELRYPERFVAGQDRVVELEGEAFFEVVNTSGTGKRQAFIVKTSGQLVEVLGTKFNIAAYPEESAVRTTLAEGSVQVSSIQSNDEAPVKLVPGEQSVLTGLQLTKQTVDVSAALAWTRGDIVFDETDLATIFRQLERWYAVEFDWGQRTLSGKLYGKISRHTHLEQILRVMEQNTDLKFTIHQSPSGERRVVVH